LSELLHFLDPFPVTHARLNCCLCGWSSLYRLYQLTVDGFSIVVLDAKVLHCCLDHSGDDSGRMQFVSGDVLDLLKQLIDGLKVIFVQLLLNLLPISLFVALYLDLYLLVFVDFLPGLEHLLHTGRRNVLQGTHNVDVAALDLQVLIL
jgi:hypothetical protein